MINGKVYSVNNSVNMHNIPVNNKPTNTILAAVETNKHKYKVKKTINVNNEIINMK